MIRSAVLDRRRFLKAAAATGAAVVVDPAIEGARGAPPPAADATADGFLGAGERAVLARLADHVLSGASQYGVVDYIEGLLTAFDHDPPRIYAGGPFSGRHPLPSGGPHAGRRPDDDFSRFVPLNRVQERAWRIRLYGSSAEDAPMMGASGPVTGLRVLIVEGARQAFRLAHERDEGVEDAWSDLSDEFRREFTALVLEGSFGDPVYGGNRDGAGWKAIGFEGDSLPLGFTPWDAAAGVARERPEAPVSRIVSGSEPDPEPLRLWTRLLLRFVSFAFSRGQDA